MKTHEPFQQPFRIKANSCSQTNYDTFVTYREAKNGGYKNNP